MISINSSWNRIINRITGIVCIAVLMLTITSFLFVTDVKADEEHRHYMITYLASEPTCAHDYHLENYHKCLLCDRYYQFDTSILANREYDDDYFDKASAFAKEYGITYEPGSHVVYWDLADSYVAQYEVSREDIFQPPLAHRYGEWETVVKPTCISAGLEKHTCTVCKHIEQQKIDLADHAYGEWISVNNAGCESEGLLVRNCSYCHKQESQTIEAAGHQMSEWTIEKEAGCETDGLEVTTCTNCDHQETRSIAATGHDYTEWTVTVEAGCDSTGREERTCSNCGLVETREIEAIGHSFGEWKTCSAEALGLCGELQRECSVCGFVETDDSSLVDHIYGDWEVITEPGCETTGIERHLCEVCGKTEDMEIPATGHSYGEWEIIEAPGCETEGAERHYCLTCSASEDRLVEATGHSFSEWTVTREAGCETTGEMKHKCIECGFAEVQPMDPIDHDYGVPEVVTEPGCITEGVSQIKCSRCDAVINESIPANGHDWEDAYTIDREPTTRDVGIKSKHCRNCDEVTDRQEIAMIKASVADGRGKVSMSNVSPVEQMPFTPSEFTDSAGFSTVSETTAAPEFPAETLPKDNENTTITAPAVVEEVKSLHTESEPQEATVTVPVLTAVTNNDMSEMDVVQPREEEMKQEKLFVMAPWLKKVLLVMAGIAVFVIPAIILIRLYRRKNASRYTKNSYCVYSAYGVNSGIGYIQNSIRK